jgi:Skp family chaperone for outer membrane proteins
MKLSIKPLLLVGMTVIALAGCDRVTTMKQKIACIDMAQVLRDSVVGEQEAEHNKQVKAVLLKAQRQAQNHYKGLSDQQLNKARMADTMIINQQWLAEQRDARNQSIKIISGVVDTYRKEHGLTLVIDSTQVIAADGQADISADIIEQLKDVKIDYGELPRVSFKGAGEDKPSQGTPSEETKH